MQLRLGVQVEPQFGFNYLDILNIAKAAEDNNFSHLWLSDHFFLDENAVDKPCLDLLSVIAALSRETSTLRLGSLVLSNSYRHPAVLAKALATIDHLSAGRLEWGYGAGWKEVEYNAYGIPYPSAGVRIKQLVEGIQVIRKLWSDDKANFQGEYYQLKDAISAPKPVQEGGPPLWVGTMKAGPKMLRVIGEYAHGANIAWRYTPDQVRDIRDKINVTAEQIGRSVELSLGLWAALYPSEEAFEEGLASRAKERGLAVDDLRDRLVGAMHGSPDYWVNQLKAYADVGVETFVFMFPHGQEVEQVRLVNELVIPRLR